MEEKVMLKPALIALAAVSFVTLGACTQETRVEDDSAAESIENAGDELEDAAQDAGNTIEEAGEDAAESVEDATDGNPNTNP
jgi:preprotein translocase subunit Sec63